MAQQIQQEFTNLDRYTTEYRSLTRGYTTHEIHLNVRNRGNGARMLNSLELKAIRQIELIDGQNNADMASNQAEINTSISRIMQFYGDTIKVPLEFDTPMGIRLSHLRIVTVQGNPIEVRI
jgi:hypothetical protein